MSQREGNRRRPAPEALFMRWLWLVYMPLGVLAALLLLAVMKLLPGWTTLPVLALAAYSVLAGRLILERRRKGLSTPAPRALVFGIGAIAGAALLGLALFFLGWSRLSSTGQGQTLLAVGAFLMILSVTAPAFKLIDVGLKTTGRMIEKKRTRPSANQDSD